jgi:hypothetical protein
MEQHVVKAPVEGWVRGCKIEVGQQVSDNTILCHIEVGILELNSCSHIFVANVLFIVQSCDFQ